MLKRELTSSVRSAIEAARAECMAIIGKVGQEIYSSPPPFDQGPLHKLQEIERLLELQIEKLDGITEPLPPVPVEAKKE